MNIPKCHTQFILKFLSNRAYPFFFLINIFLISCFYITQVLARKAKNQYFWKGFGAIPKALEQLKVIHVSNFVALSLMFMK